jgi:hypothetical protein
MKSEFKSIFSERKPYKQSMHKENSNGKHQTRSVNRVYNMQSMMSKSLYDDNANKMNSSKKYPRKLKAY